MRPLRIGEWAERDGRFGRVVGDWWPLVPGTCTARFPPTLLLLFLFLPPSTLIHSLPTFRPLRSKTLGLHLYFSPQASLRTLLLFNFTRQCSVSPPPLCLPSLPPRLPTQSQSPRTAPSGTPPNPKSLLGKRSTLTLAPLPSPSSTRYVRRAFNGLYTPS